MKSNRPLKFGIELEVATSKRKIEVINALREAGINVESSHYGSAVSDAWKVQADASINGWEIVSPPLTNTDDLKTVCHVLRKVIKARSSKKCGLHIHHDVNDFNLAQLKSLYRIYDKFELPVIKSIMSPHRYHNEFCLHLKNRINRMENVTTIDEWRASTPTRYLTLNNKCYLKYGTIEFRGAQGTVEIDRILAWIELTHKVVELAEMEANTSELVLQGEKSQQLEVMFNYLDLSETTRKHYRKVQKFFAKLA